MMSVLAADSLEGRRAGSEGSRIAARLIAEQFELPGSRRPGTVGSSSGCRCGWTLGHPVEPRVRSLPSWAAFDSLPPAGRVVESNVIGMLPGTDPDLREEYVLVTAHYDHLGVGRTVDGDSIYNGADDDASGVIGLIEIARAPVGRASPPNGRVRGHGG